jgi:catechol 2,3-dioxygenase-like lactoylglutathione lyase family enzyme
MALKLTKDSIDLGIITTNPAPMVAFYRDVLGFEDQGTSELPGGERSGGTMYRLMCGTSLIKVVAPNNPPKAVAAPGGLRGSTGYRYWTITIDNLEEVVAAAEAAGTPIVVKPTEIRPGVSIAMLEDPDGNWVELLTIA